MNFDFWIYFWYGFAITLPEIRGLCLTKNLTERLQEFAVSVYFLLYFFPHQCHGLRYFRAFHWTLTSCFWRVCRHHRLTLFSIKLTSNDFLKSFPTFNISLLDNNRKDHLIPHVTKFCKKSYNILPDMLHLIFAQLVLNFCSKHTYRTQELQRLQLCESIQGNAT